MSEKTARAARRAAKLRDAAREYLENLPAADLIALLSDKGIIAQGENAALVQESEATRVMLESAYQQGRQDRGKQIAVQEQTTQATLNNAYGAGYQAGLDTFYRGAYETWIEPAHEIEKAFTGILNFVTGIISLMYGRNMERTKVVQTFEPITADLAEILNRADLFNRRYYAAYGEEGLDLSKVIALRDMLAAFIVDVHQTPLDSERLFDALRAVRHHKLIDRAMIARAANKPGEYAPYTEWITQHALIARQERGLTWDQTADALISELEDMAFLPNHLEEGLKLLRANRDQGRHGDYVKTTCKNRGKDQRVNRLTRTS